jgi:hypothetical protein
MLSIEGKVFSSMVREKALRYGEGRSKSMRHVKTTRREFT